MKRAIFLMTLFALFLGCGNPPRNNPLDPANPNGGTIKGYVKSNPIEPVQVPARDKAADNIDIDIDRVTIITEPPSGETTPDSTGVFIIDSVPPGWIKVIGIYEGDSMFADVSDTVETLVYAGGITDSIELTLDQIQRMGRIEGIALHIFGDELMTGLKVRAYAFHSAYSCTTRTDINGFFSLPVPVYTPVRIVALPVVRYVTLYPQDSIILFDDEVLNVDSIVVGEIDTVWNFDTDIMGDVPPGWVADNRYWTVNELGGERAFFYEGVAGERDMDIALYNNHPFPQQCLINMNVRRVGIAGDDWMFGAILSCTDEMRAIVIMLSQYNIVMMSTYPDSASASISPGIDFIGTNDITIVNYDTRTILCVNGEQKLTLTHPPYPDGMFGLAALAYDGNIVYDNIAIIR